MIDQDEAMTTWDEVAEFIIIIVVVMMTLVVACGIAGYLWVVLDVRKFIVGIFGLG